mgnify:CR=1 FL=1
MPAVSKKKGCLATNENVLIIRIAPAVDAAEIRKIKAQEVSVESDFLAKESFPISILIRILSNLKKSSISWIRQSNVKLYFHCITLIPEDSGADLLWIAAGLPLWLLRFASTFRLIRNWSHRSDDEPEGCGPLRSSCCSEHRPGGPPPWVQGNE